MLYLLQVIVYTALMCIVYILFLRNRQMHAFNRAYLLLAAIMPVVIPFIKLPEAVGEGIQTVITPGVRLPEFVAGSTNPPAFVSGTDLMWLAYAAISFVMLGMMIYKWITIRRAIRSGEQEAKGGYTIIKNSGYGPGSWHRYIFLPSEERNEAVIQHELAHIRLRHTRDVMLLSALQIIFWPNLLLVWIKKELMQVHEFQADERVACDKEVYTELLVSSIFNRCTLPTSHSFIIHPIKRRLMMLRKKNSNVFRVLFGGLAAIGTMFLLTAAIGIQSCKEKKWEVAETNDDQPKTEVLKIAEKMPEFNGDFVTYMTEHIKYPEEAMEKKIEGRVTVKFIVTENGEVTKAEIVKSPDPSLAEAALKVVNDMPNWIPGENGGKKVPVYMYLPVSFKLSS